MSRFSRRRRQAALAASVLVLAACSTGGDGPGDEAAAVPAGLESFYSQQLEWGTCEAVAPGAGVGGDLECARVTVPLDYAEPGGETASVAISRARASGVRIGSLLVNPGGPGASGLALASVATGTPVGESFDVVGFDPRGVGASTPAVQCLTGPERDADRAVNDVDSSPEGIAASEARSQERARLCAERTGVDVLAHVGTREVVRDMDVVRAALGEQRLDYLGYSYGTRLGTAYAEAFPDNVRAMVLDGAIDPAQSVVDQVLGQAEGFQQAFDAFAADCTARPDCPLGTDPAGATARFRELVDPLIDTPAATTDPRGLSYGDAITGVQQALYSPNLWTPLRGGLAALTRGQGDSLLMLADLYEGRADDGTYTNIEDAFDAVRCVDDPPETDRAAMGAADTAFRNAAPFLDDGRGTGAAPLDLCAFWPVPPTSEPRVPDVPGLPPVLVVSTTGDPATPYRAGVDLADALGAELLTFEGAQHTVVFDGEACVDDAVAAYLRDPSDVPEGLRCG
ncbi:alpha/beta hydrolase [Rhodococcus rhodnii]|uniref:Proteinase n=1 Tax=Rhodococcus rhodnii LMG 5362 TaxID=1273125 RepID=R7WPW0_9NOCA|nr:proteinase [Rhodococcus rhodnii LMG 5362]